MDLLDRLLEHQRWGNTTLLETCRDLTDEQLDREFDIGHRTLRKTFEHIISNMEGWTAMMVRIPPDDQPDNLTIPMQAERHDRAWNAFADVARRMRDEDRLEDTFTDFFGFPQTYGAVMLHLPLHDAEHRAEALHILNRLDIGEVPELDHALWDLVRRGLTTP